MFCCITLVIVQLIQRRRDSISERWYCWRCCYKDNQIAFNFPQSRKWNTGTKATRGFIHPVCGDMKAEMLPDRSQDLVRTSLHSADNLFTL